MDLFASGLCSHLWVCGRCCLAEDSTWKHQWSPHETILLIHCPRNDLGRVLAKVEMDCTHGFVVVSGVCPWDERGNRSMVFLEKVNLNKLIFAPSECLYQDAEG